MARDDAHPAQKLKAFISYSRKDMAFADRLEPELKAQGIEPLIDRTEIHAFEDWWKRIQALIGQADSVIFVLSPDAVASDVCKKEVAFATSLNKRFAPIVFRRVEDKEVPKELARLNFIFFDDEARFDESVARLTEALNTDIDWVRRHTEFGQKGARLGQGQAPRRVASALALARRGRALDCLAPAWSTHADGGNAGVYRGQPARDDEKTQHSHGQSCNRPGAGAWACRARLLGTRPGAIATVPVAGCSIAGVVQAGRFRLVNTDGA
jgi:TIR domain-containing protein